MSGTPYNSRIRWNAENGHDPCEWCGGAVKKEAGQTDIGWKRTAYCSYECRRHRVHALKEKSYIHKARQIAPWPVTPRYSDTPDPGDGFVVRYDTPITYQIGGSSAGQCADDADSEF